MEVKVVEFRNYKVRLGIMAPKHITVHRAEVQQEIDTHNNERRNSQTTN